MFKLVGILYLWAFYEKTTKKKKSQWWIIDTFYVYKHYCVLENLFSKWSQIFEKNNKKIKWIRYVMWFKQNCNSIYFNYLIKSSKPMKKKRKIIAKCQKTYQKSQKINK